MDDLWLDETGFRDLADGREVVLTTGQRLRLRPIPWERLAQAIIDAHPPQPRPRGAQAPWDDDENC